MKIKVAPMFQWSYSSIASTRPSGSLGSTVTPGNNTMGTAVELISGANLAQDCWLIELMFQAGSSSGVATMTIADLLVDPTGGSSYTAVASSLLMGSSSPVAGGTGAQGTQYVFPLKIKAGSSIAVKTSQNGGTVASRAWAKVYGLPKHPEHCRSGSFVRTFGGNRGASGGTAITCGQASEGSWTSVGTSSDVLWHWQLGVGVDNATMASMLYGFDVGIGDGSSYRQVISDYLVSTSTAEQLFRSSEPGWASAYEAVSGSGIYVRGQSSGVPDSGVQAIVYGVGGGN